MFDVLITIAEKDFNKLRFVVKSIALNVEGFNKIYIVSDKTIPKEFKVDGVLYFTDDIIDFNFSKINIVNRIGWYKQQFIKLFQDITLDNYLVIDSDAYINSPLTVDVEKPSFWFGEDQCHKPYFNLMKNIFELDKCYPYSFINEMMFFKRDIIVDMVSRTGLTKDGVFDLCVKEINRMNNQSGFSEYELYGNYVTKYYPGLYDYVYLKVKKIAKQRLWTDEEMAKAIESNKYSRVNIISMHSWI